MAKRKSSEGEALNLDSLMDTVTNVVGVLMIVLIMVSLNIATSVSKILSDLPPVAVEELERLKKELVDTTPKQDPKVVDAETKKLEDQIKKITEELKTMDLTADQKKVKMMDLDELQKQLAARKKTRDAKKTDVEKLLAEVDKLKALLDTTPVYQPPPATVVKLPNPREIPKEAVMHRFLVTNGRVYYLNDEAYMKVVVEEIDKFQKELIHGEVPVKDKDGFPVMVKEKGKDVPKMKTVMDQKKMAAHFERRRVDSRDLKVELIVSPNSARIPMRLTPLPNGGETTAQMKDPASVYQRLIRKLKSEPNTVVQFLVFKDSVEAYLVARDVTDAVGVPVTWEIYGNQYYQRNVQPYEVDFTPPPPPPPPKPGQVRIPPPKVNVD